MKVHHFVLAACLFFIVSASLLYGQGGANGTILGTVTDSSGAVVGNAQVDVTNVATGVVSHTSTSANGDFTSPYLAPGIYSVTVQAQGFQRDVADNITLAVAQQARVNVVMKPGQVSETVQVEASSVSLDTDSAAVAQLVSQKQVEQLPLNGRNFLNLLFIGAGAVQTTGEQGQMRQGEGNAISINGGRPTSNNYTLDGLVNTDTALNTPAVILSQDAIQEFKVQSETYSAEYGFSANQVNIVSKSGSNQLHGTAFEFLRNDAFDAKAPFQSAIPELRQNQFGFVLGGPIYIPKVYDGRNKTFFLVNYEGWRIRNGINQDTFNVPDPAQLGGNFSASGLTPVTAGCIPSATTFCMPIDPTTGAPFPGNVIPTGSFSRLAQVAIGARLFPAPNCFASDCHGNYRLTTALPNTVDQQTYKLDQQLGRFGSVFFRYTTAQYENQNINGSVSLPFGIGTFNEKSESWMISHTIPLTHSLVNNFRFGRLEPISIQAGIAAPESDVTALGLTGVFPNLPAYARLYPGIGFQGLTSTAFGSQGNNVTTSDIPTWEFADSLSMTHGRHTVSVGFDYRRWVQKRNLSNDFLGQFTFNNDTISQNSGGCPNPSGDCGTGNSVADFLLGYYNNASTFQPGPFSPANVAGNLNQYHFQYFAPYIQDDWKVTGRLTLNLGLRWDYRTVPFEQDNKMFWFDRANAGGGLCYADKALGTANVTGLGGPIAPDGNGFYRFCGRNNPAAASKKPFAPRIGFAYRLGDKTVVRGGYGIFFDSAETREIDDSGDIYPFVVRASPNPTKDTSACVGLGTCLPKLTDNMFPAVPLHQVSAAADGSQFFAVIISEFPHNPYVQQWSLSVQRELARNTTLEVNYVGNKGTHLLNRTNIGQGLPPADPTLCDPSTGGDPTNVIAHCPAATRRPFTNITSANGFLDSQWNGYSSYNAGNVKLERRSSSIALVAVYTWAKSLDDKSAAAGVGSTNAFAGHMNENNQALDYGRSDFDVNHRFVTSVVYQLPVGRGKRFGGNMNRAADLAIGGWQITGITTFQKGFPYSVLANDKLGLLTTFTQRANLVPGCNPDSGFHKSINEFFNTACFVQPLAGQFGNSGRDILRGPGINNWDMGIGKDFKFTERIAFQFRAEAFNVFNHAQYGYDPNTATSINAPVDNNPNDSKYGQVIAARPGRIIQLGGKIVF
jgi:outer membrane receptor protein involved in Fe transport